MNYKNIKKNQILYIIIFVLIITILIMIFLKNPHVEESFDDCSKCIQKSETSPLNIQTGISTNSPDGTINFSKSFNKTPSVFTQMNISDISDSNAYTIQISNITPNGFKYNKKKIFNQTGNGISIVRLDNDSTQSFSWIAI